jgi:hypothetical protein
MRLLFPLVFAFFLAGCGTTRTEVHAEKEVTVAETKGVTPEGKPYTETTVTKRDEERHVEAKTVVEVPEIKAIVTAATNTVAPGLGGILGGIFGWATGTPDGALTASGTLGLVIAVARRGLEGERNLKKKTKYLEAVVEGNSNFMQAHPEYADLLKNHQRSAQVDEDLKGAVKAVRLKKGLI